MQAIGVLKSDLKSFGEYVDAEVATATGHVEALKKAEELVAVAATTRLEFKLCNAMCSLSTKEAIKEIKNAEREYGLTYKLVRQKHVHAAVLAWRNEVIGNSA